VDGDIENGVFGQTWVNRKTASFYNDTRTSDTAFLPHTHRIRLQMSFQWKPHFGFWVGRQTTHSYPILHFRGQSTFQYLTSSGKFLVEIYRHREVKRFLNDDKDSLDPVSSRGPSSRKRTCTMFVGVVIFDDVSDLGRQGVVSSVGHCKINHGRRQAVTSTRSSTSSTRSGPAPGPGALR
jgi:hypothetical protein